MKLTSIMILGFMWITSLMSSEKKTYKIKKKPYGAKMCARFRSLDDCVVKYVVESLTCHVTFLIVSEYARKHVTIYRTSKGKNMGLHTEPSVCTENMSQENHERNARVLIAPFDRDPATPVYEMDLSNQSSLKPFFNLTVPKIVAIAFMYKYRRVFVASKTGNIIYAYSVNTQERVSLKHGIWAHSVAVDEEHDILILTGRSLQSGIYTLSVDDKKLSLIYKDRCMPIVLDVKKRIIYTCCGKRLFSISYKKGLGRLGQKLLTYDRGCSSRAIVLDQKAQYLYYNCDSELRRTPVNKPHVEKLGNYRSHPLNMVLHKEFLYFTALNEESISVINIVTLNELNIHTFIVQSKTMCLMNI